MVSFYKLLFKFVYKLVLSRSKNRHEANALGFTYMDFLEREKHINLLGVMINHIAMVGDMSKSEHSIPYDFFLCEVITHFGALVKK